ncbi:MAG: NAD-dependent epimerase/dehydratase family protein [Planctomycetes bacterium]|nr:NAD-dependent epimerase/dehydratase family protein [Planctomycetota bacterium]
MTAPFPRTVALVGPSTPFGGLVLDALKRDRRVRRIVALDDGEPVRGSKVRFHRADLRDPALVDLLKREQVEAVVHTGNRWPGRPSEEAFDRNVLGTMHLLAICEHAGVRKVVLPSTTLVYGPHFQNPNFLPETRRLRARSRHQYLRDLVDIDRHAQRFARLHPECGVTILRFAPLCGPTIAGPLRTYTALRPAPIFAGFDPMWQMCHEEDAVGAVLHAMGWKGSGAVNVAADGASPILRILRRCGTPVQLYLHPAGAFAARYLSPVKPFPVLDALPFDLDYLRFVCIGDTSRMKDSLGFRPRRDAAACIEALRTAAGERAPAMGRKARAG